MRQISLKGVRMGTYKVDEHTLNQAIGTLNHIEAALEKCYTNLNTTAISLKNQSGLGVQNTRQTINAQKEQIRVQKMNIGKIRDCIQSVINKSAEASAAAKRTLEGVDLNQAFTDGAQIIAAATAAAAAAEAKKQQEAAAAASANQGSAGNATNNTNGSISGKIPSYALEGNEPNANGIYGPYVKYRNGGYGRVCEWNKENIELSCTYYTLRKLNERGISYPCIAGPGNGGKWYSNFDFESGLPTFEGNDALRNLANSMDLPQTNIVVSFSNPQPWGHVMLIDEITRNENGTVVIKSSDNYPQITSLNGSNPQKTRTVDQFYNAYQSFNGNIVGLCVLGNR